MISDFLLRYTRDITLPVVETKSDKRPAGDGLQQAKDYAAILGLKFAYATNGTDIIEYDFFTAQENEVERFPTPDELWFRYQQGQGLSGAVANARLAYEAYEAMLATPRWQALAARGAHPQRPLWASTSTKNPAYRDVIYVEELIGPDTVNTIPPATLVAFNDHGVVASRIKHDVPGAHAVFARLTALGAGRGKLALPAVALDGVDGWLARRSGLSSDFGARYDMETDALLILVLAVLAWRQEKAGAWIVLAGAMRYLFVAAGYIWTWMTAPLPPS